MSDIEHWTRVDSGPVLRTMRRTLTRLGRWWLRYRAVGHSPRVPETGGFLLAVGPHGAYIDPAIFALGQERERLRFMAKREAFKPVIGSLLRQAGAFPVDRSGGRGQSALAIAEAIIEAGDGVLIFPEGRFYLDRPDFGPMRTGVARLALETGAPVILAAAYGAKRARAYGRRPHRPRVSVAWGEPLVWPAENEPSRERLEQVTAEIEAALHTLYDRSVQLDQSR